MLDISKFEEDATELQKEIGSYLHFIFEACESAETHEEHQHMLNTILSIRTGLSHTLDSFEELTNHMCLKKWKMERKFSSDVFRTIENLIPMEESHPQYNH